MENGNFNKTSLNLSENIEALLAYIFFWVTGIIFLLIEKENKFVKFHAMQSLATFLPLAILSFIIDWIPIIGPVISFLIWPVQCILWILLMYKAYKGLMYKLPITGDIAEQYVNK